MGVSTTSDVQVIPKTLTFSDFWKAASAHLPNQGISFDLKIPILSVLSYPIMSGYSSCFLGVLVDIFGVSLTSDVQVIPKCKH